MKTSTLGAFVIAGTCLFTAGNAVAESGSGMTSQGLASEPAGIGERGTGQTQSTLERSGVPAQKGMSSDQAGTGQTQSTMERSGSPMPSGVGEQGTGQMQSMEERSGGQGSAQSQTSPSQSQSAMEHPER